VVVQTINGLNVINTQAQNTVKNSETTRSNLQIHTRIAKSRRSVLPRYACNFIMIFLFLKLMGLYAYWLDIV